MIKHKQAASTSRRYRTGQWVEHEGLYSDDWGGNLLLLRGDLFPSHPEMGETHWTYGGPAMLPHIRSSKVNRHHIGY
ncbi:hypothetical protein ACX93W_16900 [Paenibacillus sp. CAU 1782]